tara:strand:- start:162 stop:338 length:177 start_codon:yes stop_codon:yes gene_type:complete
MIFENPVYGRNIEDTENVCINTTCDGKVVSIPLDPANRHYAEIMRQVADGTLTIKDAD